MDEVERVLRLTAWATASVAAIITSWKNLSDKRQKEKATLPAKETSQKVKCGEREAFPFFQKHYTMFITK
ncbi:hypothetical protein M3936_01115 [Sutcliffiella horikoshii]|uniref:hypothetical protein n=1 Tax=Sutcliffiella horikoshii TaxID=79883 RepID=UPI00203DE871|nr:hypothetical protein [Sutcliffiella horikoshii]MCM3616168.1 hypothetical protein [Sutcliffiella horikoshii]